MLRRHARKMVELIEDVLPEAEKLERIRKANSTRINKKPKRDSKKGNESVIQRALYMRWQLGPRAFLYALPSPLSWTHVIFTHSD